MKDILLVEDSAVCRELFAELLRMSGYGVRTAGDGPEVIRELGAAMPGLIVLDLMLPSIDGLSLLKLIREMPGGREVPVIVMTGVAEQQSVVRAGTLAVKHYMLKEQLSVEKLMPRVRACLGDGAQVAA